VGLARPAHAQEDDVTLPADIFSGGQLMEQTSIQAGGGMITADQILVEGQSIFGEPRRSWQRAIAHVPQSRFLADITIAENIAPGVPRDEIDMNLVREDARQAQIDKFIERRGKAYDEFVGERDIRLSSGQRQVIGIARALYKQASVLIFDEATSSLDNPTEQAVMESIESLNRD
jgi:ATP-binding cassette, subfamily B, bacterial PglK